MVFFRRADLWKHLQKMLSDLRRIIVIGSANEAQGVRHDDYVTRHMIEEFILDEQDHFNWVKGHLCLIEQIGMENYLIEMLGE